MNRVVNASNPHAHSRSLQVIVALLWVLCLASACAADSAASNTPDRHRQDGAVATLPDDIFGANDTQNPVRAPHALENFYAKLLQLEEHPDQNITVRITQVGDSHTASDTFTGPVRSSLQERFGDGGRGYLAAGKPWKSYRQRDAHYDMSSGWNTGNGLYQSAIRFALSGVRIETSRSGEWIERGPCGRCEGGQQAVDLQIFYQKQPDGGHFRVLIDGVVQDRVSTRADGKDDLGVFELPLARSDHRLRIETEGDGSVALFGTSMTDKRGVILDSIGINGAQLQHFLSFDAMRTQAEFAALAPDLVIIAFGANETVARRYRVSDPATQAVELLEKLQVYHREIVSLLQRYKEAKEDVECLVLLPPDTLAGADGSCISYAFEGESLTGSRCVAQPPPNFAGILNAQRYAARSVGCAVWDQQHAMGGEGSMDLWRELGFARKDGVHLRSQGYDLLADAFVADLIANYEAWRDGRVSELITHVIFPELATTARDVN